MTGLRALGIRRPSRRTQVRLSRAMQGFLVLLFAAGLYTGSPKVVINSGLALAVTFLPTILERNYEVALDPWLALWVTAAVFLHTLGSWGLYGSIGWWDHLTHALSASLVAGVGYTTVRSIDVHHDGISLPRRFIFVYILLFVMAFGVLWELFEFGLDVVAAETGLQMPLSQHGLDDTVKDMMFNTLGACIVALWGQAHLSGVAESIVERYQS
ncbi:hypothetical protein [Natronoglomus mannanivorans]|uniref:DUF2238 domain-containing protein n=1 Tax=Natronoglomus mannanivorans TaxID=2979990 RepID=A0AAP2Z1Z7_9EURY|nr:hypothetical protein [Halobacteria archaeon AArc-xg1-1]